MLFHWPCTVVTVSRGGEDLGSQTSFIELPAALFQRLQNVTQVHLFFTFYENSVLFPLGADSEAEMVGSSVIGATVVGQNFEELSGNEVVRVSFRVSINESFAYFCASWDFNAPSMSEFKGQFTVHGVSYITPCSFEASQASWLKAVGCIYVYLTLPSQATIVLLHTWLQSHQHIGYVPGYPPL